MKKVHLFNDHIYLISSHAVARNPLFHNKFMCDRFLGKVEKYLSPLCEVLHYNLDGNQYQMLVKLKSRDAFCAFVRAEKCTPDLEDEGIDWTTYIFSRAMSRLLASCAIHFNRKYGRSGALFARRFSRKLISNKQELDEQLGRFDKMEPSHVNMKVWNKVPSRFRLKNKKRVRLKKKERSGFYYYQRPKKRHKVLSNFRRVQTLELRAQFNNLPPNNIYEFVHRLELILYLNKALHIP